MADLFVSTLIQGLIYALVSFGVYITYSILDFPDLGVDGTFPLGAAVTALLLIKGVDPWLTLVISLLVGALAGLFTGVVHVRLKVRDLLAGIITMTALFSVNLLIAGGARVADHQLVRLQDLHGALRQTAQRDAAHIHKVMVFDPVGFGGAACQGQHAHVEHAVLARQAHGERLGTKRLDQPGIVQARPHGVLFLLKHFDRRAHAVKHAHDLFARLDKRPFVRAYFAHDMRYLALGGKRRSVQRFKHCRLEPVISIQKRQEPPARQGYAVVARRRKPLREFVVHNAIGRFLRKALVKPCGRPVIGAVVNDDDFKRTEGLLFDGAQTTL